MKEHPLVTFSKEHKNYLRSFVQGMFPTTIISRTLNDFLVFGKPLDLNDIKQYIQNCSGMVLEPKTADYKKALNLIAEKDIIKYDVEKDKYIPQVRKAIFRDKESENIDHIYFKYVESQ